MPFLCSWNPLAATIMSAHVAHSRRQRSGPMSSPNRDTHCRVDHQRSLQALVYCTIRKGSFRRRFPPESLEARCFCMPRKIQGYFGGHATCHLPMTTTKALNIQHYRIHKHCRHRSRGAHPNPYHQSLVFSNLSDAIRPMRA